MRKIVLDRVNTCVNLCTAEKRETNYIPIAKASGTFSGGSELAEALGETQKVDYASSLPVRASLVVSVQTGIPGPGYFRMAKTLGMLKGSATPADEFVYWKTQRDALGVPLSQAAVVTGKRLGVL